MEIRRALMLIHFILEIVNYGISFISDLLMTFKDKLQLMKHKH